MYSVGTIRDTHGLKGEVSVAPHSDFPRFNPRNLLYLTTETETLELIVERSRVQQQRILVKFVGLNHIDQVLPFLGKELYVKERMPVDEDSFYYDQLLDVTVYYENQPIGVITNLLEVPQGHLLELTQPNGIITLIPFVKYYVSGLEDQHLVVLHLDELWNSI
jgi:16S rRNA processing protein RimM